MTYSLYHIARRTAFLVLAVLLSLPVARSAFSQHDADRRAERVERVAETLDLTEAQQQMLTGVEAEPGALWNVAASLAPTLTDAQKEKLFARPERAQRDGKRGRRGTHGNRSRHDRPNDDERAERRDDAHEAMQSALDLTDAQVAELEALHEARKAEREARRAEREAERKERMQGREPGTVPSELAAILTPEQQEILKVHRALAMRMHHGRHHRGGRRGR